MSVEKSHHFRPPLYERNGRGKGPRDAPGDVASEQRGWDAYRRWLSQVGNRPATDRAPLDHSVYSWRGYHNWADKVRQTWKAEDT